MRESWRSFRVISRMVLPYGTLLLLVLWSILFWRTSTQIRSRFATERMNREFQIVKTPGENSLTWTETFRSQRVGNVRKTVSLEDLCSFCSFRRRTCSRLCPLFVTTCWKDRQRWKWKCFKREWTKFAGIKAGLCWKEDVLFDFYRFWTAGRWGLLLKGSSVFVFGDFSFTKSLRVAWLHTTLPHHKTVCKYFFQKQMLFLLRCSFQTSTGCRCFCFIDQTQNPGFETFWTNFYFLEKQENSESGGIGECEQDCRRRRRYQPFVQKYKTTHFHILVFFFSVGWQGAAQWRGKWIRFGIRFG